MTSLSPSLRKAAVLIASLEERAAEAILESMSPDEAAKVRSALMTLDEIPADEQRRVMAEFFRQQGSPALAAGSAGDVELELSADAEAGAARPEPPVLKVYAPPHGEDRPADAHPLAFLARVPVGALVGVLRSEHPQTAAVVIAQLSPEQAAMVLEGLPASQATDALERMAWLGDIAPEVVADLARELREQLAPHLRESATDASSLAHVSAVLAAMGGRQRQQTLAQLAERNTTLGAQLGARRAIASAATDPTENVMALRYRLGPPLPGAEIAGEHEQARDVPERERFVTAV